MLAIPTGFMGATLPLLIRYAVRTDAEVGPRVALLYAINTAGAVFGTVAAAFVLLPALGLNRTVWVGVADQRAGVRHCGGARARPARQRPGGRDGCHRCACRVSSRPACGRCLRRSASLGDRLTAVFHAQPAWMLPLMLVSGANAFLYEVLWTRMLAHVMGGSIYAFATMLAAFLTGIALGGGLSGKVAENRERAATSRSRSRRSRSACSPWGSTPGWGR